MKIIYSIIWEINCIFKKIRRLYNINHYAYTNTFVYSLYFIIDYTELTDFIILIFYYLNIEFILIILILILLFNKNYFQRTGFYEILSFVQGSLLIYICWLIFIIFNINHPIKLHAIFFCWQEFFLNQYFYIFSTTEFQLKILLCYSVFLYLTLTLWNIKIVSNVLPLSLQKVEYLSLLFANIIFCLFLLKVNNLFACWCLIECISLTSYILTLFNSKQSIYFSFLYFIFNSIAGVIILWGINLLALIVNTDFFLSNLFSSGVYISDSFLGILSFNLIFIGLFIKLGLVPFHFWTIEVYKNISTELFFFFNILNKSAIIFTFFRTVQLFSGELLLYTQSYKFFLLPIVLISIFIGVIITFNENSIQGFLILSSLPQLGYVLLGFLNPDFNTRVSALIYFIFYIFSLILLYYIFFFLSGSYTYISDLTGLFYSSKFISFLFLFTLGAFSSIPPFITFLAKFFLLNNLLLTNSFSVVIFLLGCSIVSLIYYLRIASAILTKPSKSYTINIATFNSLYTNWLYKLSPDKFYFVGTICQLTLNFLFISCILLGLNYVYSQLIIFFFIS